MNREEILRQLSELPLKAQKEERITSGCDVISPAVLPYEIGNALTALIKRRKLSKEEALAIFDITQQIPLKLFAVDIKKALTIAMQFNIYAYDAYFIQSALSLLCPIITLDKRMKEVAKAIGITVLE